MTSDLLPPSHSPTALDYHTAESLHAFLELSGLILPPHAYLNWKRITTRPTTILRGQPHQGLGVPEITNEVLTYWRRLSDNNLILVSAFNVRPAPRVSLTFLGKLDKARPRVRSPRTRTPSLLLADFC